MAMAVGISSTSATKVARCVRMNSSHRPNSVSLARRSVCSAFEVPRRWCQESGMEMIRPKASVSRVARRPWASRSASRATAT
ncbi:hypothetical protein D3C71_1677480 [compost metagenome]